MIDLSPQEASIADAAIRVIVNQGFDVVSVRKVAKEAGVAPGTVQYFMGNKEDLLNKALLRSASRQRERITSLDFPESTPPGERLSRALMELLPTGTLQREDGALWVTLGAAAATRQSLAQLYRTALKWFQDALISRLMQGELDAVDAARKARLISALVNGLTLDYLHSPPGDATANAISEDLDYGLSQILK